MSRQFMVFPEFKLRAVTFSYDDGAVQDVRLAQIMKKNGIKGTFNLNSYRFIAEEKNEKFLSEIEAEQLYSDDFFEVALHGYKHRSLPNVQKSMAIDEITTDRRNLEKTFGRIIRGMAYANGAYSDEVANLVKCCDIAYARTVNSSGRFDIPEDWLNLSPTTHHNNPELMELAKNFLSDERWKSKDRAALFYLWGHSYEFDNDHNWDMIEKFAEFIGNREDVWYATNGEIYEYVKAYDSLQFSLDGDLVYNPTATDVCLLSCFGERFVALAGKTVKIFLR